VFFGTNIHNLQCTLLEAHQSFILLSRCTRSSVYFSSSMFNLLCSTVQTHSIFCVLYISMDTLNLLCTSMFFIPGAFNLLCTKLQAHTNFCVLEYRQTQSSAYFNGAHSTFCVLQYSHIPSFCVLQYSILNPPCSSVQAHTIFYVWFQTHPIFVHTSVGRTQSSVYFSRQIRSSG
jgi:hypothetical protein